MDQTPRDPLAAFAALAALLAVGFGAFAAHGLRDPRAVQWVTTGSSLLLPHAVAVFALIGWRDTLAVRRGAWALVGGALLFAFSLYALALGLPRGVAALAPVGGFAMLGGWAWIALRG